MVKKKKKKRGGSSEGSDSGSDYQPRKSRRARKVVYDDFVTDGDGSETEEEKTVKKATRGKHGRDSEWDSEPSESDSDYGKKKKKPAARRPPPKRKPAKKKPAKKKVKKEGSDDDSEDSDFETAARKRTHKKKIVAEAEASKVDRETRGVMLNTTFADNDR